MPFGRARRRGRLAVFVAMVVAAIGGAFPATADTRIAKPVLSLTVARHSATFVRFDPSQPIDIGAYVASRNAPFEIQIRRKDYTSPVKAFQVFHHGNKTRLRALPSSVVSSTSGLKGFLRLRLTNAHGTLVYDQRLDFCPDGFSSARLSDSGPEVVSYPEFSCFGTNPFTLGQVFGIDRNWATLANGFNFFFSASESARVAAARASSNPSDVPDGRYQARLDIQSDYRRLFDIPAAQAVVHVDLKIETQPFSAAARAASVDRARSTAAAPRIPHNAHDLPDLIALPAFDIGVEHTGGHDYVAFAANVWNRGPSPLVVEGFRRTDTELMDAYQYFFRDGHRIGRSSVGTLEYDARAGHQHWHFTDFAQYSLLDSSQNVAVRSDKEAFCLAPTDAIDLTVKSADWHPGSIGLDTACGGESALWTREVLPVGWGDTYFQGLPGQSFDITGLANGTYYIRIAANPDGRLRERTTTNNVSLRKVILGGTAGHRTVSVPPYQGIDTEGGGGPLPCPPFC